MENHAVIRDVKLTAEQKLARTFEAPSMIKKANKGVFASEFIPMGDIVGFFPCRLQRDLGQHDDYALIGPEICGQQTVLTPALDQKPQNASKSGTTYRTNIHLCNEPP